MVVELVETTIFFVLKSFLFTRHNMLNIFTTVFTDQNFLSAFFQTVILIFLGFIFMRKGLVNPDGKKIISVLIWKLAVPCFAFNAFMQDFEWVRFKNSILVMILSILFYSILILFGKLIFIKRGKEVALVSGFFMAIGQTTLFSMPILQSVYEDKGNEVMLYISSISIIFRIFVYVIAYSIISGEKISKDNFGSSMKKVFLNPVMTGMFLGILVFLIQNITPQVQIGSGVFDDNGLELVKKVSVFRIDQTLPVLYVTIKSLARLVGPLCMFMIGMTIGEASLGECMKDKSAWKIALLRNVAAPVFISLVCLLLQKTGLVNFNEFSFMAILIGFSAPVSVTLSITCVQFGKEGVLASRACVISTILTILTFPLCFVLGKVVMIYLLR